jgi:hypothetical protein
MIPKSRQKATHAVAVQHSLPPEQKKGLREKILLILADGKPHRTSELCRLTGHGSASVTARIRDLRKEKYGGHDIPPAKPAPWKPGERKDAIYILVGGLR